MKILEDALAIEDAGCFMLEFEAVPAKIAKLISEQLTIPTIGIGAGVATVGQILLCHDLLGVFTDFKPKFSKRFAKLTGRPAACLGIPGPGSTNMLTGLWDAKVDRAPVLALCGQVDTQVLGPGAFQEVDLAAAFGKVAQWSQPVLPSRSAFIDRSLLDYRITTLPAWVLIGPDGRLLGRDIPPHRLAGVLKGLGTR